MTKRDAIAGAIGALILAFALGVFFGAGPVTRWATDWRFNVGDAQL